MRIITADEMGLVKVLRLESSECLAVSPGEQTRARAVRALCHDHHHNSPISSTSSNPVKFCGSIHVARVTGAVESWEMLDTGRVENKDSTGAFRLIGTVDDCPPQPVALACLPPSSSSGSERARARTLTCTGAGEVNISYVSSEGESNPQKSTKFSIRGPISAAIVIGTGRASVSESPSLAAGGRDNDLKLWDLNTAQCTWKAKNVAHDFLDLRQPVWISSLCSLEPVGAGGDGAGRGAQQIVAGTAHRQVRLYDARAQKRPTHSVDADEHGVTTMAVAPDGREVVVADTAGLVRVLDLRKMKWGRRFEGPAGSVRGLAFHPSLPVLACVGLDRMARVYDYRSKEKKFQLYLKQRLNAVLFDGEGEVRPAAGTADAEGEARNAGGDKGHDWSGSEGWGSGEEYEMDEGESSEEEEDNQRHDSVKMGDVNNGSRPAGSSSDSGGEGEQGVSDEDSDSSDESEESESGDAHAPRPKRQQHVQKGSYLAKKRR